MDKRTGMKKRTSLKLLAATAVMAGAVAAGTTPASAQGVIVFDRWRTYQSFVGCEGWLDSGYEVGTDEPHVRGAFKLGTSTRGTVCKGWLERRTDSSAPWQRISDIHTASDTTYWYYDGGTYQARVCVGDLLYSNSYSCEGYW
ncbi:hypothetical protein [Kitasatospora sp. NPDC018619]|uniref:hypothetical protein n=1 Tax=unclassified Kitasatospora TaxID=2633591 RepID=UPI0037964153